MYLVQSFQEKEPDAICSTANMLPLYVANMLSLNLSRSCFVVHLRKSLATAIICSINTPPPHPYSTEARSHDEFLL